MNNEEYRDKSMVPAEILTPEEAASYLRVHPQTVYRKLRLGQMPGAKIGDQWRIRRADLDEYLRGGRPAKEGKRPGKKRKGST